MHTFQRYRAPGGLTRNVKTLFLTGRPSFFLGFGSILTLWGGYHRYNIAPTASEADARAMYADWRMIGQDLRDQIVGFDIPRAIK
jgi:hypothetical protein